MKSHHQNQARINRLSVAAVLVLTLALLAGCSNTAMVAGLVSVPQGNAVAATTEQQAPIGDIDPGVLRVGVSRLEITPLRSAMMGGYGVYVGSIETCRWSQGVHDPLYATAMYIGLDDQRLLLISLDLVGLAGPDQDEIKAAIAQRWPIAPDQVIISSTHTHHSPDTMGLWGTLLPPRTGRDEGYMLYMKSQAVQAAGLAFESRRPAQLSYGVGELAEPHWNHYQTQVDDAPIDHTLTVLQAADFEGRPIVTVLNWGCHPTCENGDNLLVSSDWVGSYYAIMRRRDVGIPMFINGSIGASIQPSEPWREQNVGDERQSQGFVWADAVGRAVAQRTIAVLAKLEPLSVDAIKVESAPVTVTMDNRILGLAKGLGLMPFDLPPMHEQFQTKVTLARIGELWLATVPGELSPQIGMTIREAVGGKAQIICGLSQDYLGYIIDVEQYEDPIYRYEKMLCVGPDIADGLIAAHSALAAELQ
ncbi:MAG: hypothetical protein P9M14_06205 [Candidatus Alcyoniella australis]|nr:hypothetical protein [Candidatus Alcyoniella australis]